jgi:hypothetical protein
MDITKKLGYDLGVALNEARLAGLEYRAKDNIAAATFVCLTLPMVGPEPEDARRQFIFHYVGRIAASLRLGRWDDANAPVEHFDIANLLTVVQSFGCQPIYGWEFFNVHEKELSQWGNRISLDLRPENGSIKNSISLFQEAPKGDKHLDLCLWFESFEIRDAQGKTIALDDFISGGMRWWNALSAGDKRTQGHGIVSGGEWKPSQKSVPSCRGGFRTGLQDFLDRF